MGCQRWIEPPRSRCPYLCEERSLRARRAAADRVSTKPADAERLEGGSRYLSPGCRQRPLAHRGRGDPRFEGRHARAFALACTALEEIGKSQYAADVYTGFLPAHDFEKIIRRHHFKSISRALARRSTRNGLVATFASIELSPHDSHQPSPHDERSVTCDEQRR